MASRKFTWDCWDLDDCGDVCYVVSKDECPNKEDVLKYIAEKDLVKITFAYGVDPSKIYHDGWCCWQCSVFEGERTCGYIADFSEGKPRYGAGWFPVWIVRRYEITEE